MLKNSQPKLPRSRSASYSNRPQLGRGQMTRNEREQHELMVNLGLGDFETWKQCSERQAKMARRFKNTEHRPHKFDWEKCEPEFCASTPCLDGCWFASRRHRYQTITEAHRLFSTQTGDLVFVTVAHPTWELPAGNLDQTNIN